jgi:ATP-dependent DNA ligase I
MRFYELVEVSNAVANVSSRLDKTRELSALLKRLPADEIDIAVSFLSGAPRQGRIGLGWAGISGALQAAPVPVTTSSRPVILPPPPEASASLDEAQRRDVRRLSGLDAAPADPELVEGSEDAPDSGQPLELRDVDKAFDGIARTSGPGSALARVTLLKLLFARATAEERDFLVRLLSGELRQGALEGILTEAIARAVDIPAATVRQAAMTAGDLRLVARVAFTEGPAGLSRFSVQLFRPLQPMLAESAATVAEALQDLGEAAFEFKLDGARIQVHKAGDDVRVFSRTLRDVTAAVPEVLEVIRPLPARDLIVDGEVLALRPDGVPQPFQETMRRFTRKLEIARLRQEIPLTAFLFDCLYIDGEALLEQPQSSRFARLTAIAPHLVVPHITASSQEAAAAFLDESVRRGHEGVIAKAPDARYVAGSRGRSWLKIKVVRTLDLVVLAAEWGHGRRRGWLSNLHLGARNPEADGFVMLGKTFKGLTDDILEWQTRALLELETRRDAYTVYVRPELVVEIAFNDIQESPHYPGRLALRFARVKAYRPDKTAAEADTLAAVQSIYRATTGKEPPVPIFEAQQ